MCRKWAIYAIYAALALWTAAEAMKCFMQLLSVLPSNHGLFAMTGSFDNPGPLGGFLAVNGTIATSWLIIHRKHLRTVSCSAAIAVSILTFILLPATMSRAAWTAYILSMAACVMLNLDVRSICLKHKWMTEIICIMLVATCTGAFLMKKDSAIGRLHIWRMELQAIAEKPLSGHGTGSFAGTYGRTQENFFRTRDVSPTETAIAGCPEYAFNEYLKIGVEHGIPAMLLCMGIIAIAIFLLLKKFPSAGHGAAALSVFAFFSYPLSVWQMNALLTVFLALAFSFPENRKWLKHADITVSAACLAVLLCFSEAYMETKSIRSAAVETWYDSRSLMIFELNEEAAEGLSSVYGELKGNFRYLYDYGYALHKCGRYAESTEILSQGAKLSSDPMFHDIMGKNHEAEGRYMEAENEYWTAHYMVPCRLYPMLLLQEMYLSSGETEKAAMITEKALSMPVNDRNRTMMELRDKINANAE